MFTSPVHFFMDCKGSTLTLFRLYFGFIISLFSSKTQWQTQTSMTSRNLNLGKGWCPTTSFIASCCYMEYSVLAAPTNFCSRSLEMYFSLYCMSSITLQLSTLKLFTVDFLCLIRGVLVEGCLVLCIRLTFKFSSVLWHTVFPQNHHHHPA